MKKLKKSLQNLSLVNKLILRLKKSFLNLSPHKSKKQKKLSRWKFQLSQTTPSTLYLKKSSIFTPPWCIPAETTKFP